MNVYVLNHTCENEFKKLERSLKKYNMIAYKKLLFEYYPALKDGNFVGKLIEENKNTKTYELVLPSDKMFVKIHGEVKLIYDVNKNEKSISLKTITPTAILLEGYRPDITTYKGVMISKKNASHDIFKINLLLQIDNDIKK